MGAKLKAARLAGKVAAKATRGVSAGASELAGHDIESRHDAEVRRRRQWGLIVLWVLRAAALWASVSWGLSATLDTTAGLAAYGLAALSVVAGHRRRVRRPGKPGRVPGAWDGQALARGVSARVFGTRGAIIAAAYVVLAFVVPFVIAPLFALGTIALIGAAPLLGATLLTAVLRRAQTDVDEDAYERYQIAGLVAAVLYVSDARREAVLERLTRERRDVERTMPNGATRIVSELAYVFAASDAEAVQLASDDARMRDRVSLAQHGAWDFESRGSEVVIKRADDWTNERRDLLSSSSGVIEELNVKVVNELTEGTAMQPVLREDRPDPLATNEKDRIARGARTRLADGETITLRLAKDSSPALAERVAAWARTELDADVVEWAPYEDRAEVVRLSDEARVLRDGYSALLRVEPHNVRVDVALREDDQRTITVESAALRRYTHEKREELALEMRRATPGAEKYWGAESDPVTGIVTITEREDSLGKVALYPDDATPTLERVPFAIREDGSVQSLALLESNILLGGIPGGGKSGGLTALLRGVAHLENVALIGLDPKRVELSMWHPRFSGVATVSKLTPDDTDSDKFAHATAVLEAIAGEMDRRYEWLEANRLKKLTAELVTAERPLIVLVVDELADLLSLSGTRARKAFGDARAELLRTLVALGRAAGVVVITATQKPTADVVPTSFRDLIAQRVGYKTTTPSMTDVILGHGMSQLGGLSHEISADQRGVAYTLSETSSTPERTRTLWIPDDEVAGIAERTAHLRVELPWLPTAESLETTTKKLGRIIEEDEPATFGEDEVVDGGELDLGLEDLFAAPSEDEDPFARAEAARAAMSQGLGGGFDDLIDPS